MNFKEIVNKDKDNLLKDLVGLLKINTVLVEQPEVKEAPFGQGLKDALNYVLNLGLSFGFKTKNVDNVAGHIEYGEGSEIIGILCHLDVVPVGDGWKYPPFSGTIEGDKLYARGALDDKGPLMSSLYALKVLKDNGVKLNKRVRLIVGTDEENDWRCIKRYLEVCEMPDLGFSPDADFPIIYGEKGIMSLDILSQYDDHNLISFTAGDRYNVVPEKAIVSLHDIDINSYEKFLHEQSLRGEVSKGESVKTLTLYGVGAHAMEPDNGVNSLVNMAKFLKDKIDNPLIKFVGENLTDSRFKKMGLNFKDSEMGDLTVNVAVAKIDSKEGRVGMNLRYPINWDKEKFLNGLRKKLDDYGLKLQVKSDSNPHYVDKNSELVRKLHAAYIHQTNDIKTPLLTIGGGTYARALNNAVAFGMLMPGREDVVHQVNEYIYISDLLLATAIYAEAIYSLGR